MARVLASLLFLFLPIAVMAQSVITLDSLNLDTSESPTTNQSAQVDDDGGSMKDCLLSNSECTNKEFGNAASFSINDVVNLGVVDREQVDTGSANVAGVSQTSNEPLPTIDIEILFDYNSSAVRPDQITKLRNLASILQDGEFRRYGYAFFGHTDAKGSTGYNLQLSRVRAKTVSSIVADLSGLPRNRFISQGLGYSRLKTPSDPFGSANRRVQLVLVPLK